MRRIVVLVLMASLVAAPQLRAQQAADSDPEEKELAELLSVLQQDTAVATKSRINSDYVPGIVTVLEGEQLEALGITNAWEALGLVPGMQAVRDARSSPSVFVRGIDFPFNNGNIQILINSIAMSRPDAGINASALLIPVEQIERIEIIRGPGSVIYGDFAFMGLVNIITKRPETRVYTRGQHRFRTAGADFSSSIDRGALRGSVSRGWSDDAPAGSNFHNVKEDRWIGMASFERGRFSLTGQTVSRGFQGRVGAVPAAPPFHEQSTAIESRYGRDLRPHLRAEASLGWLGTDISNNLSDFRGDLTKFAVNVISDVSRRHSWLAGADFTLSNVSRTARIAPGPPGQPPVVIILNSRDRKITGLTLQDRFDIHKAVSLTLGARYDSYSDLDSRVTPRASMVWRASDHHIVKAQYAEGFRPPTFFELYAPPPPGSQPRYPFEVNATTELNYVYRSAGRVGRATFFRSLIKDMIRPGGVVTVGEARASGVELEWTQQITPSIRLDANASHVSTRDPRNAQALFGGENPTAPDWMGNIAVLVQPFHDTFASVRVNHVGKRIGGSGYDVADVTLSRHNLFMHGLSLRAGVKNAQNEEVRYLSVRPTGVGDNLLFPTRTLWVQISWRK